MARVKVNYLTIGKYGHYSDGQSIVEKEEAMMPDRRIDYYLPGAELRGLDFGVETEVIEVSDEDAENYTSYGYQVL